MKFLSILLNLNTCHLPNILSWKNWIKKKTMTETSTVCVVKRKLNVNAVHCLSLCCEVTLEKGAKPEIAPSVAS